MTIAPNRPVVPTQRTEPADEPLVLADLIPLTGRERHVRDLPAPRQEWESRAACRLDDPDWLPTRGDRSGTARRKALCAGCMVSTSCLLSALRSDDRNVMAAGLTAAQRDQLLKGAGISRPTHAATTAAMVELQDKGWRVREIADKYGLDADVVRRRLKQARRKA